jgi:predicted mannosyl-3-phosphoglycerate phosphatase (HAD superfamily)
MRQNGKKIIYTNLDGTFLNEKNYSFLESLPALRAAQARDIPVIFCSSKTRAEIEHLRRAAEVNDPFIVENGGADYVPEGYFPFTIDDRLASVTVRTTVRCSPRSRSRSSSSGRPAGAIWNSSHTSHMLG